MRACVLVVSLGLAGCLPDGPSNPDGGALTSVDGGGDASAIEGDLALGPPDLTPPPDLFPADIAGMTNCFGVALCDPTQMFCIRFHSGSQGTPGNVSGGPACYSPVDDCAAQGQQMDCGCIQNDATLGTNCQGSCVDHMDGTF